ncbi:MAG: hypothetical protein HY399_04160 [Elusimicrobia bacterium]|nr:hypothetical protein [Elusimicrobiota bacterium]
MVSVLIKYYVLDFVRSKKEPGSFFHWISLWEIWPKNPAKVGAAGFKLGIMDVMDLQKTAEDSRGIVAVYWWKKESSAVRKFFETSSLGELLDIQEFRHEEYEVSVLYPATLFSEDVSSWLSILSGGAFIDPDLYLAQVYWPKKFLNPIKGPRWGLAGLKKNLYWPSSACLVGMLTPFHGVSLSEMKKALIEFGKEGADILLDDERLMDPPACPFEARLEMGLKAAIEVEKHTGRKVVYVPNVTDRPDRLVKKLERVISLKGKGVAVNPYTSGMGSLSVASEMLKGKGFVVAQKNFAGPWLRQIAPELALVEIPWLCGADVILCPGMGEFASLDKRSLERVALRLKQPLGDLLAPGLWVTIPSGIHEMESMVDLLGKDIGFVCLMGGADGFRGSGQKAKQLKEAIVRAAISGVRG